LKANHYYKIVKSAQKQDAKYSYYRDRRAKLREEGEASGISKRPAKTPAERKREQRALEKAAREAAKLTQTALKPQSSTSRAPEIAVQHEPMDIYIAATNQTSGPSGWGQHGAGDTYDEMEYIMMDAPLTSRAPVIIIHMYETYAQKRPTRHLGRVGGGSRAPETPTTRWNYSISSSGLYKNRLLKNPVIELQFFQKTG
jgi:hypothetical protein